MENLKLQTEPATFLCENCEKMINSSSNICRFCGFKLNDDELGTKIKTQTEINQAYNDANNLNYLGVACLAISVPRSIDDIVFGYFTNSYVNYFPHGLVLIFLFFLLRWQIRFGKFKVENNDFKEAKKNRNFAIYLWLSSIFLIFALVPLIEKFIFSLFN